MGHPREPIKHTCPDIDELLKDLNKIKAMLRNYESIDEVEKLKDLLSEIETTLWGFDTKLEELRQSNDVLRKWGIREAEKVDELQEELLESSNLTLNKKQLLDWIRNIILTDGWVGELGDTYDLTLLKILESKIKNGDFDY